MFLFAVKIQVRIMKLAKYIAYIVVITAVLISYSTNRERINEAFPFEDLSIDLWQDFKSFITKFSVVPEYVPKVQPKQEIVATTVEKPLLEIKNAKADVEHTIVHQKSGKKSFYGFNNKLNLVAFADGTRQAILEYSNDGVLQAITAGERVMKFNVNPRGQLTRINDGYDVIQLKYDFNGWLKNADYPYEKLAFQFDAMGRLMTFKRGEGYETKFTYYKDKLDSFVKEGTVTKVVHNADGFIKGFTTDDSYFVLNYGKDNLLSYLAGAKYGLGETISYNTNDESIVSSTDDSIFTGEPETARIAALNLYLTCAKFKKLPVLFDPLAYSLYTNYFKQDIVAYLVNNFVCSVIYGRD